MTAQTAETAQTAAETAAQMPVQMPALDCKAAYCMDAESATAVFGKEEKKHLPIASMCKIMTLLLTFDAIDDGKLGYDTLVPVSEHAMSMGGSQVYLEAGEKYTAEKLIESVIVCSANDSCVALAEYVAGSDTAFTEKMNKKAKELGCRDTLFANCTGLPKEPQYSCAYDVAQMFRALIGHEKFFEFSAIRTDNFLHPTGRETLITNTNKLVRRYEGCDGGKTGFTNQAGFCLAATAKRGDMRVISVCIGSATGEERFQSVSALFDYAFGNYESKEILKKGPLAQKLPVSGGRAKEAEVEPQKAVHYFAPVDSEARIDTEINFYPVKAPVEQGQIVGEAIVFKDGVEYSRVRLVCNESVERATYGDRLREIAEKW
jgi:D-alanyl-D-alanine carboxypeptidase (penicillin-binding protein 5/6)